MNKILIANRGEVARRVQSTCDKLGIQSVCVFSDADRDSLHVQYAHEAYCIGAGPSSESYLNQDRLIQVAKDAGCNAVHPGYGFLAENAAFAQRVVDEGLVWIGPSAKLITLFGDKLTARVEMERLNVPLLPGTNEAIEDINIAKEIGKQAGYPLLLKAAGGGGGKGMRIVEKEEDLERLFEQCSSEAMKAFSDPRIFVEKYLQDSFHIEFQVLGDKHGNAVHFGYRECSVQRRHQKVIEECPSLNVQDKEVVDLLKILVNVVSNLSYDSLGTFEFLKDQHGKFYFLEMNTRLQVEHSVTEMTHQVDLVEHQIKVAFGEKLTIGQKDISREGWAIECRLYAEDCYENFAPSPGKLQYLDIPRQKHVRLDNYLKATGHIPLEYDPMFAKASAYGINRNAAIVNLKKYLKGFAVQGFPTNINFHLWMLEDARFIEGKITTDEIMTRQEDFREDMDAKAIIFQDILLLVQLEISKRSLDYDKLGLVGSIDEDVVKVFFQRVNSVGGTYFQSFDKDEEGNETLRTRVQMIDVTQEAFVVSVNHKIYTGKILENHKMQIENEIFKVKLFNPGTLPLKFLGAKDSIDTGKIASPINGKVVSVKVLENQNVNEGDILLVLEAMKMENEIKATSSGLVNMVNIVEGDTVNKGDLLVDINISE
ncbi:MAG: biotin/lipoyl-binding protein [Candidatus Cloacimonetes bacterium]|nr:biotin/lipoyl-binding protein [Candidatus Cloacimonadota bacterium]